MSDILEHVSPSRAPRTQNPKALARGAKWLSASRLRPTRQRVALAALLIGDGKQRHFTVEDLYSAARAADESVSLATVYNTVKAFCDVGLVQEVTVDGARSYYDTNTHDHPHFFWQDEGRLSDAPADGMKITGLPQAPDGAEVISVDVVIRLRRRGD